TYRDGKRVIRRTLTEIADQFHHWVINRAERWGAPIVEAPQHERRDDFVLPYLQKTAADHVAVILKAREPARILVAIGGKQNQLPSSGAEAALGESIQSLSERPTVGTHVCSHVSLLSLLRPSVPQSAP